jgi:transposase-like protein
MPRKKPDAAGVPAASPPAPKTTKATPGRHAHKGAPSDKSILDAHGLEPILEAIESGKWLSQIAQEIGVPKRRLHEWIGETDERANAVKASRMEAGHAFTLKAERVLLDLEKDATNAEVQKARELKSHYHWMAERMNRNAYGTQTVVEIRTDASDLSDAQLEAEIATKLAAAAVGGAPLGTRLQ